MSVTLYSKWPSSFVRISPFSSLPSVLTLPSTSPTASATNCSSTRNGRFYLTHARLGVHCFCHSIEINERTPHEIIHIAGPTLLSLEGLQALFVRRLLDSHRCTKCCINTNNTFITSSLFRCLRICSRRFQSVITNQYRQDNHSGFQTFIFYKQQYNYNRQILPRQKSMNSLE